MRRELPAGNRKFLCREVQHWSWEDPTVQDYEHFEMAVECIIPIEGKEDLFQKRFFGLKEELPVFYTIVRNLKN